MWCPRLIGKTALITGGAGASGLADERDKERAQKRRGGCAVVSLDEEGAEERYQQECSDGTIKLWNLAAKQEVTTLRGHDDNVNGIAFSRDEKILASVGRDKTVRLWRAPSFAEIEAAQKRQE